MFGPNLKSIDSFTLQWLQFRTVWCIACYCINLIAYSAPYWIALGSTWSSCPKEGQLSGVSNHVLNIQCIIVACCLAQTSSIPVLEGCRSTAVDVSIHPSHLLWELADPRFIMIYNVCRRKEKDEGRREEAHGTFRSQGAIGQRARRRVGGG